MAGKRSGHARGARQDGLFASGGEGTSGATADGGEGVADPPGTRAKGSASGAGAETSGPPALVVIDGHGLAYRSYFGVRDLSTSRGQPTNAVYGFARTLLGILEGESARDATVVAFDAPAPTFRHERYEQYKAGRAPTPDDLPQQIALIKRLVDLLGVARVERPGLEADDLMGTIARRGAERGYRVEVLTSDHDALQLVGPSVSVRNPDKDERIGPEEVFGRYGVRPDQWVDYRALTGDSSDNIPGVRGIGPVAARSLLQRYGSIDTMLADLAALEPASTRRKLEAGRDDLELSRELSRIVTDADVAVDPEAWSRRTWDREPLTALLRELEFGSILQQLGLMDAATYADADWGELPPGAALGFVLDGERATAAALLELARAADGRVAVADDARARLAELAGGAPWDACDAKALTVAARRMGIDALPGDDPLLMAYLLDPAGAAPASLARRHGAGEWGPDARGRAVVTAELLRLLSPRLRGAQRRVYVEVERPLQAVLAEMELAGVRIDRERLAAQSAALGARLEGIEAAVRELAGDAAFNLNSRDQVAALLFDSLGLRPGRRTSTGKRSTAVSALEPLAQEHEVVRLILEHRELAKLKSTYLDPLPSLVDTETGRLHTTFNQTVVATGRLSSANPNLQNIPVRTELGRAIREAFVAEPGTRLLVADYSQIELRVLAHIAQEPALIRAFREGEDIHRRTAAEVHGVATEAVTPAMRRTAKVINFGVLYGMSAHRLARELGIGYEDAEAFIATYFERYPRVRAYIDHTLERCRQDGWVETLLGRRRLIPDISSPNRNAREYAERTAYNMPIQGSAADIMKLAMLALAPALRALGGRLLLQVHDEIVAEVPEGAAAAAAARTRELMASAFELRVPLAADVGVGSNWLDAK